MNRAAIVRLRNKRHQKQNFMQLSLSREEFWILDAVVQLNFEIPLSLLNHPRVDISFNKQHHNLTTDQLVDLLEVMQKKGDLAIYRCNEGLFPELYATDVSKRVPQFPVMIDYTPIGESLVFYPKAAIIECFCVASEERKKNPVGTRVTKALCFCATRQGATKWEQTAQVDWNKYVGYWQATTNDADLAENQSLTYGRVAALSEQTLDAYFEWKIRWGAHPDSWETSSFRRYHTERIAPWKATYWKTFPEAFACDFTEYTVRRSARMYKAESERHHIFWKQSWSEHHALFDWCNKYVKDFPFAGD